MGHEGTSVGATPPRFHAPLLGTRGDGPVIHYQYTLDILTEDARPLDRVVLAPDWAPALEWARFEGIRAGRLPAVTAAVSGEIEPVWDGTAGEPFVAAFRAVVRAGSGDAVAREIP